MREYLVNDVYNTIDSLTETFSKCPICGAEISHLVCANIACALEIIPYDYVIGKIVKKRARCALISIIKVIGKYYELDFDVSQNNFIISSPDDASLNKRFNSIEEFISYIKELMELEIFE
jgi:hypothetical protein